MVKRYQPVRAKIGAHRIPTTGYMSVAAFTAQVRDQIDGIIANTTGFIKHLRDANPEILYDALKPTYDTSQALVPIETGKLKLSGYLETRTFRRNTVVEIGYGKGGSPFYAPIVHERLDMRHMEPTQAKFLQQPLEENASQIRSDIIRGIKEASGV